MPRVPVKSVEFNFAPKVPPAIGRAAADALHQDGLPREDALLIGDLSFHACKKALDALADVVKSAPQSMRWQLLQTSLRALEAVAEGNAILIEKKTDEAFGRAAKILHIPLDEEQS